MVPASVLMRGISGTGWVAMQTVANTESCCGNLGFVLLLSAANAGGVLLEEFSTALRREPSTTQLFALDSTIRAGTGQTTVQRFEAVALSALQAQPVKAEDAQEDFTKFWCLFL